MEEAKTLLYDEGYDLIRAYSSSHGKLLFVKKEVVQIFSSSKSPSIMISYKDETMFTLNFEDVEKRDVVFTSIIEQWEKDKYDE